MSVANNSSISLSHAHADTEGDGNMMIPFIVLSSFDNMNNCNDNAAEEMVIMGLITKDQEQQDDYSDDVMTILLVFVSVFVII